MEKKSVHLSQCMIVKNEEANIEKALSWGKEIACEQIVVDTGSTDRTVELAKAMGAKVFSFEWIDDFAAAKNFAISKASGDWVAFLDADEVFVQGDEKKLVQLLSELENREAIDRQNNGKDKNIKSKNITSNMQTDAVWVSILDLNDEGEVTGSLTAPRIFRNCSGLGYFGRIHEYLKWSDGRPLKTFDASEQIFVLHTGYQEAVKKKKQASGRNERLIRLELQERPNDYHMMGYLGDDYFSREQKEDAVEWYQKAIDAMPKRLDSHDQRSAVTFSNLMKLLGMERENEGRLQEIYQTAVSHLPEEPDFDYIYGICLMGWKQFAQAKSYFEQAFQKLKRLEQSGSHSRALMLNGNLLDAFTDLAWCCVQTSDANRAVELCVQVLRAKPLDAKALKVLLKAFRGEGFLPVVTPEQTIGFLGKICDLSSLRGRYLVLYAAKEAPYPELVSYMEDKMFSQEEKEGLEKAGL